MRQTRGLIALCVMTLHAPCALLGAQQVAAMQLVSGSLAFDGDATLGEFTGTTTTLSGALTAAASVEDTRGWVEAPARSLVTGNDRRDRDMYKSLEVEKYPLLRFELEGLATGQAVGDSMPATLRGRFTIRGVTREHAVPGWLWLTPASARFTGQLPMNLEDYQIGGLSKLLGMLKMDKQIVVRMDVRFAP